MPDNPSYLVISYFFIFNISAEVFVACHMHISKLSLLHYVDLFTHNMYAYSKN